MKGLLKASIATLVLAVTSASSFAADLTNNTQSSSLSTGAVVGGVTLLIAFLVVPTIKANDKVAH